MRKHTARHWLHATLDLLPVILIPVFMIYSHRHDLSTDITIQQDVYKDFYQGVKNGKPTSFENWNTEVPGDFEYTDNSIGIYGSDIEGHAEITFNQKANDVIYFSFEYKTTQFDTGNIVISLEGDDDGTNLYNNVFTNSDYLKYSYIISYVENIGDNQFLDIHGNSQNDSAYIKNIMLFNLTTIFGSGNEPTKEVFESYLTQDYYDFGSNEVKIGTVDVQAKNNDIMSVFMDSFNNSINKYFNMGNVFNMTSVYNWFITNIFGGNAPVVIYSVWNIVLYEFVMDLLFLLYGLFMWFIDMCKRLMEKPLDSIK